MLYVCINVCQLKNTYSPFKIVQDIQDAGDCGKFDI